MVKPKHPIEIHFDRITRYHYLCFSILFLCKIPIYWHVMNLIFISPAMDFECDGVKNHCPCNEPSWDRSVFTETIQTKYDIYCENTWVISLVQSVLHVGAVIGSLTFGFLADRYGRLKMFTICLFLIGIFGCLTTTMYTVTSYIVMRCLEGVSVGGAIVTSYVLVVEYCSKKHRDMISAIYHIPLNIGHTTMAGISYLLRDFQQFQNAISIPILFCVLLCILIYESPKWLLDTGKINEGITVLQKIGEFNGETISEDTIRTETELYIASQPSQVQEKINFWDIFKYKTLTVNFICMSIIFFICGMGYYGVSQYIGRMSGDIHKNVAISGVILIPGTLAAIYFLRVFSRRTFLMLTHLLSGILLIIVICLPDNLTITRMIFACLGNTFCLMSLLTVFLYGVELFPTVVRSSVMGILSVLTRVGQITAPVVNATDTTICGAIFGLSAILGAALCYPLPYTKNTDLPSTLGETEAIAQRKKRDRTIE